MEGGEEEWGGSSHSLSDLPFATLCAILESEHGYRRNEIRHLTPWYVKRVLWHPRNKDGGVAISRLTTGQDSSEAITMEQEMRNVLWMRGYPEHLIEWKVQEALGGEGGASAALEM